MARLSHRLRKAETRQARATAVERTYRKLSRAARGTHVTVKDLTVPDGMTLPLPWMVFGITVTRRMKLGRGSTLTFSSPRTALKVSLA